MTAYEQTKLDKLLKKYKYFIFDIELCQITLKEMFNTWDIIKSQNEKIQLILPREPAIIKADWIKNIMYPGYNPCKWWDRYHLN